MQTGSDVFSVLETSVNLAESLGVAIPEYRFA
jgi:hypothetical protein